MVVDEQGAWTELANQSSTMPVEAPAGGDKNEGKSKSGKLGLLSRQRGRERSSKAQEPGVLGKEGARNIIC